MTLKEVETKLTDLGWKLKVRLGESLLMVNTKRDIAAFANEAWMQPFYIKTDSRLVIIEWDDLSTAPPTPFQAKKLLDSVNRWNQ